MSGPPSRSRPRPRQLALRGDTPSSVVHTADCSGPATSVVNRDETRPPLSTAPWVHCSEGAAPPVTRTEDRSEVLPTSLHDHGVIQFPDGVAHPMHTAGLLRSKRRASAGRDARPGTLNCRTAVSASAVTGSTPGCRTAKSSSAPTRTDTAGRPTARACPSMQISRICGLADRPQNVQTTNRPHAPEKERKSPATSGHSKLALSCGNAVMAQHHDLIRSVL
jgi:hypothetical protein